MAPKLWSVNGMVNIWVYHITIGFAQDAALQFMNGSNTTPVFERDAFDMSQCEPPQLETLVR
jgi:hypothetical protein